MLSKLFALIVAFFVILPAAQAQEVRQVSQYAIVQFGQPPAVPSGPLSVDAQKALRVVVAAALDQSNWGPDQDRALDVITKTRDPRMAWIFTDMMRFTWQPAFDDKVAGAAASLLRIKLKTPRRWSEITDHLIAWDIPDYPGYLGHKRTVFTNFVDGWDRIFTEGDIEWRLVSWGGVLIDNRPYNRTDETCNCIPAADNPVVTSASKAKWLKDDAVVFGIEVNGEYRAYPRQIMEVREMVNDTLGGRHLGIPYCTLCGAAQAYYTDKMPLGVKRPVLRTSGLLSRSNKVMYDLNTYSVFDTFTGDAVTGKLRDRNITLKQASVVTTDWGTWKAQHPQTTVLAERYALGRDFDFRNGRDAGGPIFPVGDVDPRLDVHEDVVGVFTASGKPVAFQRSKALLTLKAGQPIRFENVRLELEAGGLKAVDAQGNDLGSHQAFWFAWSQFHPTTALWKP